MVMVTPNRLFYSSIISTLTPHQFHNWFLRWLGEGHEDYDNFPTYYRCNTRWAVRRIARQSGFEVERVQGVRESPYYLKFSRLLFRVGVAYDRIVSSLRLEDLQPNLFFILKKGKGGSARSG